MIIRSIVNLIAVVLFAVSAGAQDDVTPPDLLDPNVDEQPGLDLRRGDDDDPWLYRSTAKLRALDKVTAETRDLIIRFGFDTQFGNLTLSMPIACAKRPPEKTPETWVGLQIIENRTGEDGQLLDGGQEVFSAWMLAERPAYSPLEHPVYDVWPLCCGVAGEADSDEYDMGCTPPTTLPPG